MSGITKDLLAEIGNLLAPDVTINGKMALSLGIKTIGTGGTYTVPGETP